MHRECYYHYHSVRYGVHLGNRYKSTITEGSRILSGRYRESKVILFGSYAKDTQTDDSDIELLVVTNDNFAFESFAQKMEIK